VDLQVVTAVDQAWATDITYHHAAEKIALTGGDRGCVLQERAQLAALEQTGQKVLFAGSGDGTGRREEARALPLRPGV